MLGSIAVVVLVGVAAGAWRLGTQHTTPNKTAVVATTKQAPTSTAPNLAAGDLVLDTAKNYGNVYANGLLPVGDQTYSTTETKVGSVYTCNTYASSFSSDKGGAGNRGPWFTNDNTRYDINKKAHVQGSVMWQADFAINVTSGKRVITTNGLPSHPTGVFPIAASDAAYAYDRNPNSIKGQTFTYSLTENPTFGSPSCMGGEVGVMLTGVPLFNAFDAGGRDAGAWEVQDSCSGHPQISGEYHYHTLSSCITDASVHTVIGYALDGFPITGPNVGTNNILTTKDLDACHGITSQMSISGKNVTAYHYVMTQDFPYSVSCFRAAAANPPGQQISTARPPH